MENRDTTRLDDLMDRIGICFLDRPDFQEQLELTKYAEQMGFESVWVCETRLVRDAISVLGGLATVTDKIKLGTGVINNWTRGPGLTALTFSTLYEISHGRSMLGIGAYWEPIAWNQGIERKKPLQAMREYVDVVRRLLNLETVTQEGEIVKVRDLKLDLGHGASNSPRKVPIYIGATGLKMCKLTGEIADGILLNANLSVEYTQKCIESLENGAREVGRNPDELKTPQLLFCSMLEDGDKARDISRYLVTLYLGQQPHMGIASGLSEEFLGEINKELGGWPPKKGGAKAAMRLVDDSVVNMLTVSGTPDECKKKVKQYTEIGVDTPILIPVSDNGRDMIKSFAEGYR